MSWSKFERFALDGPTYENDVQWCLTFWPWFVSSLAYLAVAPVHDWWEHRKASRRAVVASAISDLERLNEVLSAGIADQVRVREIIEKLKGAAE